MVNKELAEVSVSKIVPYENNPRINDSAVDAVKKSIEQCDYISPIVVDENMVVLAGHTRLKALKELGEKKCQVVVVSGLSEEQKKKYRLLDNKTNEIAEWDFEMLEEELQGLDFGDLELDWLVYDESDFSMLPEPEDMHTKPYENTHYLLTVEYDDDKTKKKIEEFCDKNGINYVTKEN